MTVPRQDQDPSDVEVVVSTTNQSQEYNVITMSESTPSKQISPSVATNSGTAPSFSSQESSNSCGNAVALQDNDNNSQSTHITPQQWNSLDNEVAQDKSVDSLVRYKLSRRTAIASTATPTSKKFNPFLVQDLEPKSRSSSVASSIGNYDAVDEGEDEDEDEREVQPLYDEQERHSDYSSGNSTPTLAITPTLAGGIRAGPSPSTAPSSPSTRPMTRSTSKNQFLESLDQDDEHEIRLLNQRRQPQTTPTRQIESGQPQPIKRNHTVDLWGRAYYEPTRNSSLTRTPSKKRNAQGKPIRLMSPPGRAFDPLSYDPLTQYKLRIPHLSDQEDSGGTQEDDDSEQDGPSALSTQEDEEDSFRTPKRKRRSKLPLMKLERPFAARSCQSSDLEQDEQDPKEVLDFDTVNPDDSIDPEEELYDVNVRDEEGPYDEGPEDVVPAEGGESEIEADQKAKVQGDDDSEEITQVSRAREGVHGDASEDEDEGDGDGPSVQSTPSKYRQRDRRLFDLNSRGPLHFIGDDFQTPPRKKATRDHFSNLQPPPAPKVPDWAMYSQLSDRQSRYNTPGWIPASGSQVGDSPSRGRSLRTPSFGSKLGSSKNPRN